MKFFVCIYYSQIAFLPALLDAYKNTLLFIVFTKSAIKHMSYVKLSSHVTLFTGKDLSCSILCDETNVACSLKYQNYRADDFVKY